jgi:hypothetical protein
LPHQPPILQILSVLPVGIRILRLLQIGFMKFIPEKLKGYFPTLTQALLPEIPSAPSFDIIRDSKTILKEMEFSKRTGNLVGVYSDALGTGLFLLGVQEIVNGDDGELVIFYPMDMSGFALSRRTIHIREINMLVPFNNPYIQPLQPVEKRYQVLA